MCCHYFCVNPKTGRANKADNNGHNEVTPVVNEWTQISNTVCKSRHPLQDLIGLQFAHNLQIRSILGYLRECTLRVVRRGICRKVWDLSCAQTTTLLSQNRLLLCRFRQEVGHTFGAGLDSAHRSVGCEWTVGNRSTGNCLDLRLQF